MHGRDHRPGGMDPIPGLPDHVVYPTEPIDLPLSLEASSSGWNGAVSGIYVDSTRRNNFRLTCGATDSFSLVWRMTLGPGDYTLYVSTDMASNTGTMTARIAGAYPTDTRFFGIGEDLTMGVYDFSTGAGSNPECRRPQDTGATLTSGVWPSWTVPAAPGDPEGVSILYTLATSADTTGGGFLLNGGPGYFFFMLDLTGRIDLSEMFISYDQP
jgi:hypothetical protein